MSDVRQGAMDATDALSGGASLIGQAYSPGQHARKLARSVYTGSIAAVLRERIISGALPDGAPLAEVRLAHQLSVSRGPVRNALQVLEGEGLVSTLANGRTVVVGFGPADLSDLFDTRFALESTAIQWGMARQRPLDEVLASFEEMKAEGTSTPRLVDLDVEFHRALVALSGSRFLVQSWLAVAPVIHAVITLGNRRLAHRDPEQNYERIIASHEVIVDALLAGKADAVLSSLNTQFAFTSEVFESEAR
ncbi:MAG TPA: GntR family transcriptional regulator [Solirubrobacteraceae bacterium]|jgi:DNA-binding GntR family transcriptional regulator